MVMTKVSRNSKAYGINDKNGWQELKMRWIGILQLVQFCKLINIKIQTTDYIFLFDEKFLK